MEALAAGMLVWKAGEGNQTLKNYILYNDACLKMEDKFDFLQKLLTQFNGLRAENDADAAYEKEIEDCVGAREPDVARASKEWETASADFVDKMNNPPAEQPRKDATADEDDVAG